VGARLVAAVAALALLAAGAATAAPDTTGARAPGDVVRCVVGAYDHCALDELDAVLSADFQFDLAIYFPEGLANRSGGTRAQELKLAKRLMGYSSYYRKSHQADRYGAFVTAGAIEEGIDPEHPDSTCQYRLLVVHDFLIHFVRPADYNMPPGFAIDYLRGLQVLHVVRGDAAVCLPGQPADSTRWYLRRWLQDPDALTIALSKVAGECTGGAEANEPLPAAPTPLALRAIGVPLCPTLKVLCDLPGSEPAVLEVYDIQGRRLAQRNVTPQSPGSVLVEAGGGQRFTPGAYWVRLAQGRRAPVTRLVMVAR
jgi:hypothetical protein